MLLNLQINQNMVATPFTETSQNSTLVHVNIVSLHSSCRTIYLFQKMLLSCLPSQLFTPAIYNLYSVRVRHNDKTSLNAIKCSVKVLILTDDRHKELIF